MGNNNDWIIVNHEGDSRRYEVSGLYEVPDASTRENHGVSRENVWITKSGQVIVETYSIWATGNGGECEGSRYHFADAEEIAFLAEDTGDDKLLELVPIAE